MSFGYVAELPAYGDGFYAELPAGISSADDVVIALMGVTGAGKSTFIKTVTGREDIVIGHELTSETLDCKAYHFHEAGVSFALVDTPGFNDTYLDDAAILAQLAAFMEATYKAKIKLSAIIYLHPITNDRLEGSALDNLSMLRKLCGPEFYPNVVLATSFWSCVNEAIGLRREAELKSNEEFWGGMVNRGSEVVRLPDERAGCIQLLMRLSRKEKIVLQIQDELVNKGLSVSNTSAGTSSRNFEALEALRQEFTQRLADLAEFRKAELDRQQAEFARLAKLQQDSFRAELLRREEQQNALFRAAEERQRQMLETQEQLLQLTRTNTERLKAELERLALSSEERQTFGTNSHKKMEVGAKRIEQPIGLNAQLLLFNQAMTFGSVKAKVSWNFHDDCKAGRSCSNCRHACSAQLSYFCGLCQDFNVCSTCFDKGNRCRDLKHTLARRSLVGTDAGKCRRTLKPIATRYRVPCDCCSKFLDGYYLHCCFCKSDNYDLCLDCVIKGQVCLNSRHTLQFLRA